MKDQPVVDQQGITAEPGSIVPDEDVIAGPEEFLESVRRAAGWRVSPRQLEAAVEALVDAGQEPNARRVAEVVTSTTGQRSQRQRRHPEFWRLFGAQLAAQGKPATPEAQRDFIRQAHSFAGNKVNDRILLLVAIQVAANETPLEPRLVGETAKWLLRNRGESLSEETIAESVPDASAAVLEAREQAAAARRRRELPRARSQEPVGQPKRSTGRWPRGSSYRGKPRRRS